MPTSENLVVTALPHSADPTPPAAGGEPFHVSLFITHRLTPEGAEGHLSDFPNVADWADRLLTARIRLFGSTGEIAVQPLLDDVDASLWHPVFPGTLAVRGWQTPDHTTREWRTFPAHRMEGHALGVHAVSMFASPTAPPGVAQSPLTNPVISRLLGPRDVRGLSLSKLLDPHSTIDATTSTYLDSLIKPPSFVGPKEPLPALLQLLADVHQARRYYQRPEEQRPYRQSPLPDALPSPRPLPPDFDFHQRAAALADLPPLLRRLGLVIDLVVSDVSVLAAQEWICGQIDFPGRGRPSPVLVRKRQPRTRCQVVGRRFVAVSASGDWVGGALRVDDRGRFAVLALDPDASALKLEQFLRSLARLKAIEANGDPVSAAPPTLRATGFAVARVERAAALLNRLAQTPDLDTALEAGTAPELSAEQVTRGLRVEVWDDVSGQWHSLHRRRLTVALADFGTVIDAASGEGFLQGASLTKTDVPGKDTSDAPFNAHEVLAGWDGWSLSVPRPGPTLTRRPNGEEVITDDPASAAPGNATALGPVTSTVAIEPGTLPRLRYGRRYALRLWSVDLAGNSPDRRSGPDQQSAPPTRRRRGTAVAAAASSVPSELRDELSRLRGAPEAPAANRATESLFMSALVGDLSITGVREVDQSIVRHLSVNSGPAAAGGTGAAPLGSRLAEVVAAFDAIATSDVALLEPTDVEPDDVKFPQLFDPDGTISTPTPFLRWDPVLEPTVVTRQPLTEGESLLNVVLRSGVTQAPSSGDVTVSSPADYALAAAAAHPTLDLNWRSDSQRHLAPPKASQWQCELHGMFDDAIGSTDPVAQRSALLIAQRESGSFFDLVDPAVTKPDGTATQYLSHAPAEAPEAPLTLEDLQIRENRTLLPARQYIVHDVDELALPYLPDPAAGGISMVFPDAGRGHHHPATSLNRVEAMQQDYPGGWPDLQPFRLVLESGPELGAEVAGRVIRVTLPPGRRLRFRLSSSLAPGMLDLMGLWRSLPAALRANPAVAEAARDGWAWWLTPAAEVTLVHAVPRPVAVPRFTVLQPVRQPGSTSAVVAGALVVDGPSTQRIDIEATWQEQIDDATKPQEPPCHVARSAIASGTDVGYDEDLVVLAEADRTVDIPGQAPIRLHGSVQEFGDTKHRMVSYRARATTRYREYFPPEVVPTVADMSVVSAESLESVPSSARPAAPVVRDILPLFRWSRSTEPEQPFAVRSIRRAGLRVLLERPWYSSGEGEKLAVLVGTGEGATDDWVSHWAADPVFKQGGPGNDRLLPLMDLQHLLGLDDRGDSASPAGHPAAVRLVDIPSSPTVWAVPYTPVYDEDRRCWVVDIALDPGTAFWPFVKLAVARYQSESLPGMALSPIVVCDFAQLVPERIATVARPDEHTVRVVVTGPVGLPHMPDDRGPVVAVPQTSPLQKLNQTRTVTARLETLDPQVGTDLGWQTMAKTDLQVSGNEGWTVTWCGTLGLPADHLPDGLAPAKPGTSPQWRVTVEEWERLPSDLNPEDEIPGWQSRLIYADHLHL